MRYIIYGAGAIGGAIGAKLHQHGHDVVLIARGAHLQAIARPRPQVRDAARRGAAPNPRRRPPGRADLRRRRRRAPDDEIAAHGGRARGAARRRRPTACPSSARRTASTTSAWPLRRFERVYAMLVLLPATYLGARRRAGARRARRRHPRRRLLPRLAPTHLIMRVTADIDAAGFSARRPRRTSCAGSTPSCSATSATPSRPPAATIVTRSSLTRRLREEAIACYRAAGIDWASEEEMAERRKSMSARRADRRIDTRRRLVVAEHRPRRRLHRDRLPQRRDRPARPHVRRPHAAQCRHAARRRPHAPRLAARWLRSGLGGRSRRLIYSDAGFRIATRPIHLRGTVYRSFDAVRRTLPPGGTWR